MSGHVHKGRRPVWSITDGWRVGHFDPWSSTFNYFDPEGSDRTLDWVQRWICRHYGPGGGEPCPGRDFDSPQPSRLRRSGQRLSHTQRATRGETC